MDKSVQVVKYNYSVSTKQVAVNLVMVELKTITSGKICKQKSYFI
jgi:hypothetical protein